MQREYLSRNVKKETDEHYRNRWPFAADARRNLYLKYTVGKPSEVAHSRNEAYTGKEPRDMWSEVARDIIDEIGETEDKIGIDVGTSSGYFIRQLFKNGYRGKLIGVDIETGTQAGVETLVKSYHPNADITLGGSDAQSLNSFEYMGDLDLSRKIPIRSSTFDFLTELFVMYHVPSVNKAYNAAHRVVKPGGLVAFSGRGKLNQLNLWNTGATTAYFINEHIINYYGLPASEVIPGTDRVEPKKYFKFPDQSFYYHHSVEDMENFLKSSNKFEIVKPGKPQGDNIWIPNNEDGWHDFKMALLTLPYEFDRQLDKNIKREISGKFIEDFVENYIREQHFANQADKNHGYFVDYVHQNYFICRVIK